MEMLAQIGYGIGSLVALLVVPVIVISIIDLREEAARKAAARRYQAWLKETN